MLNSPGERLSESLAPRGVGRPLYQRARLPMLAPSRPEALLREFPRGRDLRLSGRSEWLLDVRALSVGPLDTRQADSS